MNLYFDITTPKSVFEFNYLKDYEKKIEISSWNGNRIKQLKNTKYIIGIIH